MSNDTTIRRIATILAIAALSTAMLFAVGCSNEPATPEPTASTPEPAPEQPAPSTEMTPTQNVTELIVEDITVGTGAEAVAGKNVTVHYTGWLTDGTKFDSSLDSGQPFQFTVGAGQVIPGWDQGVAGMKVGGKRKLVIPAELGYGAQGAGGVIPPGATLIFEVELLNVQ